MYFSIQPTKQSEGHLEAREPTLPSRGACRLRRTGCALHRTGPGGGAFDDRLHGSPAPDKRAGAIAAARPRRLPSIATLALVLGVIAPALGADLRVVTYNIHSGLGSTFALRRGRADVLRTLDAIGEAIAGSAPADAPIDVVGLNEVDFGSRRTGWIDQAAYLADDLGRRTGHRYEVVRGETWRRTLPGFEVRFGNAALVRHAIARSGACLLQDGVPCVDEPVEPVTTPSHRPGPGLLARLLRETRGVISLTLDVGGQPLDVRVTHLEAFAQRDREAQAVRLVNHLVDGSRSTIVLGDMNAVPAPLVRPFFATDRTAAILTRGPLADARAAFAAESAYGWPTFPADAPRWPLDWVLGTTDLVPTVIKTIGDHESDHRGLYVQFDWTGSMPAERVRVESRPPAELSLPRSRPPLG
jgi:endonuclease/exonuclease/phosphatase family metal-dependent hydrolase